MNVPKSLIKVQAVLEAVGMGGYYGKSDPHFSLQGLLTARTQPKFIVIVPTTWPRY